MARPEITRRQGLVAAAAALFLGAVPARAERGPADRTGLLGWDRLERSQGADVRVAGYLHPLPAFHDTPPGVLLLPYWAPTAAPQNQRILALNGPRTWRRLTPGLHWAEIEGRLHSRDGSFRLEVRRVRRQLRLAEIPR